MTLEGTLEVRLAWDGRHVRDVRLRSTRPFAAGRLLGGRTAAEAATTLPLLYSICARAQGVAALGAVESAEGRAPPRDVVAAREFAVVTETIEEYLRRILIDWPEAMGHATATAAVASARRGIGAAGESRARFSRVVTDVAAEHVYGEPPAAWLDRIGATSLETWARAAATLPAALLAVLLDGAPALGASGVALMPAPGANALAEAVLPSLRIRPDYERAPLWNGTPVETGALARMHAHPAVAAMRARLGNSVATRMAARLVELALLLRALDAGPVNGTPCSWLATFAPVAGEGVAAVQTARGLLLHRACVVDGRIAAYQIVAPTEWNFHPDGPAARGLAALEADDAEMLERRARLAVQALDPCVAFAVEVVDA